MGFLSGVLEAVKNENEVTTYDKYINKPNKKLNEVLDTLTTKIGSGSKGLAASVDAVKEWLEGYEGKLQEKTNNVIMHLDTLSENIDSNINEFNNISSYNVFQQHDACRLMAAKMNANVNESKAALKQVDKNAQNILTPPINSIHQAVDAFTKSAENNDLQVLSTTAREELANLKTLLEGEVATRVNEMATNIDNAFEEKIHGPLKSVNSELNKTRKALEEWVFTAHWLVRRTMAKIDRIIDVLSGKDRSKKGGKVNQERNKVTEAATKLREMAHKLINAVENSGKVLASRVDDARSAVEALDDALKTDLYRVKKKICEHLTAFRDGFNGIVNLEDDVRQDLQQLKSKINKELGEYAKEQVNAIIAAIKVADPSNGDSVFAKAGEGVKALGKVSAFQHILSIAGSDLQATIEMALQDIKETRDSDNWELNVDDSNAVVQALKADLVYKVEKAYGNENGGWNFEFNIRDKKDLMSTFKETRQKLEQALGKNVMEELDNQLTGSNEKNMDLGKFTTYAQHYSIADTNTECPDGKLPDAIDSIKTDVQNALDNINYPESSVRGTRISTGTILSAHKCFEEQFEAFIKAVIVLAKNTETDRDTESVNAYLKDLNGMIEHSDNMKFELKSSSGLTQKDIFVHGLKKIYTDILKIIGINGYTNDHNLANIMAEAAKYHTTFVPAMADEVIASIKDYFTDAFKRTVNNIKHRAQELYAARKKEELRALKSIVNTQNSEIQNIVDKDRARGIKCLLWNMKNNHDTLTQCAGIHELKWTADKLRHYLDPLFDYILQQSMTPPPSPTGHVKHNANSDNVEKLKKKLDTLLTKLHELNHFDRTFSDNLAALRQQLTTFPPSSFSGIFNGVLLDGLRAGLDALCSQLCYAYVNRYLGVTFEGELRKNLQNVLEPGKVYEKYDLTEEGKNCAKVCLTVLSTLFNDLSHLKERCNSGWRTNVIEAVSKLGDFLKKQGYRVPRNGKHQDGELDRTKKGESLLYPKTKLFDVNGAGPLQKLHDCLETYYQVCHISTFTAKRRPCNIYEILCWLSGLPCNAVYDELLQSALSDPFEDANKPSDDFDGTPVFDMGSSKIEAYPQAITYEDTRNALIHVCSQSYDLLTTILGTGDAATFYASDFSNNSMQFHYPTSGEDCLDMLSDILRRLLPQLQFLHSKCRESAKRHGWRECLYGKHIPTTKWQCTDHVTSKAACQPNCQPNSQATCQAKCKPNCQPMSPLMSYLNDCLPGHLPHQLTKLGCKYECATCPTTSKLGMPCMTPLGFRHFSSSIRTGNDICNVISKFLGNEHIARLLCLSPKAPSTLPEHFQFALTLAKGLSAAPQRLVDGVVTFADSFATSITKSSIKLYDETSKLTIPLRDAYGVGESAHGDQHIEATKADLSSLAMTKSCVLPNKHLHCAPYLKPLCGDNYYYLAQKDSATYLSWAIYLPWTLYRYLQCLYDAFCNISCEDWGCPSCVPADSCKKGQHGVGNNCRCKSLVECRGVLSTFYNYGFSFGNSTSLLDIQNKRYCRNFQAQLKNVLDSEYFKTLFEKCDEFLWIIRQPFSYLVLALWSLSLFYLICVMVIRLDLLHIKSHLRSPASHRIAAQSLLAAAQVGRPAKISYLQP